MKNFLNAKAARLLRKVAKHVLAEPKRMDMDAWGYKQHKEFGGPACGTVGCIAGWVAMLSDQHPSRFRAMGDVVYNRYIDTASSKAARLLGLPRPTTKFDEETFTDIPNATKRLFVPDSWPEPYKTRLDKAQVAYNKRAEAKVVAARIEHFIRTGA